MKGSNPAISKFQSLFQSLPHTIPPTLAPNILPGSLSPCLRKDFLLHVSLDIFLHLRLQKSPQSQARSVAWVCVTKQGVAPSTLPIRGNREVSFPFTWTMDT